jgi:hypothetical protein
MLHASIV